MLTGVATIRPRATQNLSRFNFDLDGLTVRAIKVDGGLRAGPVTVASCASRRDGASATGSPFTTVVRYDGVPAILDEPSLGASGFFHTDDGALVAGQPHGAATWFPVNDHPLDKASYSFRIRVPAGLEAVANGVLDGLAGRRVAGRPGRGMPGADGDLPRDDGDRGVRHQRLQATPASSTGTRSTLTCTRRRRAAHRDQFAISQPDDPRTSGLPRRSACLPAGPTLSFWITRGTEHTGTSSPSRRTTPAGQLDDVARRQWSHRARTADACLCFSAAHPFLAHYLTLSDPDDGDTCQPTGTTGDRGTPPAGPATATSNGRSTSARTPAVTSRWRSLTSPTSRSSFRASSSTTS